MPAIGRSKAAKARIIGQSTGYTVNIIGVTWEGYEGTYTYTFPYLPTQHQITQRAGDFQSIKDYETVAVTHTDYVDGYRVRRKIVDHWQHSESADQWTDSQ